MYLHGVVVDFCFKEMNYFRVQKKISHTLIQLLIWIVRGQWFSLKTEHHPVLPIAHSCNSIRSLRFRLVSAVCNGQKIGAFKIRLTIFPIPTVTGWYCPSCPVTLQCVEYFSDYKKGRPIDRKVKLTHWQVDFQNWWTHNRPSVGPHIEQSRCI